MRNRDVVNVYLFQTIIYSGIYPSGNYDYEVFINGDDDGEREYNNFSVICNLNMKPFYEPKIKINDNYKVMESEIVSQLLGENEKKWKIIR